MFWLKLLSRLPTPRRMLLAKASSMADGVIDASTTVSSVSTLARHQTTQPRQLLRAECGKAPSVRMLPVCCNVLSGTCARGQGPSGRVNRIHETAPRKWEANNDRVLNWR
jgi:hypothetical protein